MTAPTAKGLAAATLTVCLLAGCGPEATQTDETAAREPTAHGPVAPEAGATTVTPTDSAAPGAAAGHSLKTLVPGGPFRGIHGLTFTHDGRLLVGSVIGRSIHEVDPMTGETRVFLGPPEGMADDLEEGPDGTLVWTAFGDGKVFAQAPGGAIVTVAEGLPGANSLAFAPDGRLFFTQVFLGDALYEADPTGVTAPRKIMEGMGGLNGFDFGPDGKLYGPLWFKGQVARVDVDAGTLDVVAEGFGVPAAANFDSQGRLFVVDTARGQVVRVDPTSGDKTVVAQVPSAIDNLAFTADDRLFLTVMADNAVHEVDVAAGTAREVISSPLAVPTDLALMDTADGQALYVADLFSLKRIDVATGAVTELGRVFKQDGAVDYPLAVGADPATGRIAASSFYSQTVQMVDPETPGVGPLIHDMGAAIDVMPYEEDLLLLDLAEGALKRALGADMETVVTLATDLGAPVSLAQASEAGHVLVSDFAGRILRIRVEDGETEVLARGLSGPEGIALDPDGMIVVAETGARRLSRIDPTNGTATTLAEDLPIGLEGGATLPPMNLPTGVAVTADGDILLSSDLDGAIYVVTPHAQMSAP